MQPAAPTVPTASPRKAALKRAVPSSPPSVAEVALQALEPGVALAAPCDTMSTFAPAAVKGRRARELGGRRSRTAGAARPSAPFAYG
jgi:hypothetical protein